MKRKTLWIAVLCLAAVLLLCACSSTISGTWTDPLTNNTLKMSDGNYTVTAPDGTILGEGTYKSGSTDNQYTATTGSGSSATLDMTDTTVEFTDDATGTVTIFESQTAQ